MGGLADLIQSVAGGDQTYENAYNQASLQGATTQDKMMQARLAREKLNAIQRLQDFQTANPTPTGQGPSLVDLAIGLGGNVDQFANAQGTRQTTGQKGTLFDEAQAGIPQATLNPSLSVIEGKPTISTDIKEGTVFNPYGAPTQPMTTTQGGLAQIALDAAKSGTERAHAGELGAAATEHLAAAGEHDRSNGTNATADPVAVENAAKMIAEGRIPALSGYALRTPYGQSVMSRVAELNPDYQGSDYGTGATAGKAFATGKQGQAVKSFNVSLAHLDTLSNLSDALDNGNIQLVNKVANKFAAQTGGTAPVTFDAAKNVVSDEITKAIIGTGGGVADRQKAQDSINSAQTPAQLKAVIGTYKELMKGQLGGLQHEYEASTGRHDFQRYLTPEAMAVTGQGTPAAPSLASIAAGGAPTASAAPRQIGSEADYAALPSGATYIAPDGKTRRKQ